MFIIILIYSVSCDDDDSSSAEPSMDKSKKSGSYIKNPKIRDAFIFLLQRVIQGEQSYGR